MSDKFKAGDRVTFCTARDKGSSWTIYVGTVMTYVQFPEFKYKHVLIATNDGEHLQAEFDVDFAGEMMYTARTINGEDHRMECIVGKRK